MKTDEVLRGITVSKWLARALEAYGSPELAALRNALDSESVRILSANAAGIVEFTSRRDPGPQSTPRSFTLVGSGAMLFLWHP